jgi:hypothetical protein
MYSLFAFGKKRRSKRSSAKGKKSRKPPAELIKICKMVGVKVTSKRGSKRVYKTVSVLKKICLKKLRKMEKKSSFGAKKKNAVGKSKKSSFGRLRRASCMKKCGKVCRRKCQVASLKRKARRNPTKRNLGRLSKATKKTSTRRRMKKVAPEMSNALVKMSGFGENCQYSPMKMSGFGENCQYKSPMNQMNFGGQDYGSAVAGYGGMALFGKRRRAVPKMTKKQLMKLLKGTSGRRRRYRFGDGGNPSLMQSMGYEFDPTGKGGVLGMGSTGLFPTDVAK